MSTRRLTGCDYGPTTWCTTGRHDKCNHAASGPSERGIWMPECYVSVPPRGGHKGAGPVPDSMDNALVLSFFRGHTVIRPSHVYRCPCECHRGGLAGQQLDLFTT